jgi:uroporphyrin-III C-methyltransferase
MSGRPGIVHLVGAGPGDPELLTVRAATLLARADAVVYDRLVDPRVLSHARRGARLIFVGKEGFGEQVAQEEICALLIEQARLGREVVRLKGGDPFVFGRGGEEALALAAAGIPYDVVPGVSSGVAAPALAGIPVTHRGLAASVTFATGYSRGAEPDWKHLAAAPTLVLFMAGQRLAACTAALIAAGRDPDEPAAVIEAASLPNERTIEATLSTIAERAESLQISSPALFVAGKVVGLRARIAAGFSVAHGDAASDDEGPPLAAASPRSP